MKRISRFILDYAGVIILCFLIAIVAIVCLAAYKIDQDAKATLLQTQSIV